MRRLAIWALLLLVLPFMLWYDQNFRIRTRIFDLSCRKIEHSLTLVHISDLHGMNWGAQNDALIRMIAALSPDLICATGDMYTRGDPIGRTVAESLLARLCAIAPVCFVPGEHDRESAFLHTLTEAGVQLPDTQGICLRTDLYVYGCSRAWFAPDACLSGEYSPCSDALCLLLCHIPRPKAFAESGMDLMLSGDTHGGMVRLPLLGALYDGEHWLPEARFPDSRLHGLYPIGNMTLAVTAGLGGPPLRMGVPPEIQVLRLHPAD